MTGTEHDLRLLICAPAPVSDGSGELKLDTKFVEGMHTHASDWGGPVRCVLWRSNADIPFGKVHDPATLPFELVILDKGAPLSSRALDGVAAAMLSADMQGISDMADTVKAANVPFVVTIEYTLATRFRILWLEKRQNPLRLLRSGIWLMNHERGIRKAISRADGVQCNGYPAYDSYAPLTGNALLYLDNRMTPKLLADDAEMETRASRLRAGAPLRLIHSGRLEALKGSQDLPGLMQALRDLRVDATLDVYGAGRLVETLQKAFAPFGERVRLHAPVDFETELVPINRNHADIFVSCHRQQDPSCTYLEAMGCGIAVAGYANQMWQRLQATSGAGRVAPLADVTQLARSIAAWDKDREALISDCQRGLDFARQHDFPSEFMKRMEQVRALSAAPLP
ncbi:glycosyltransferase [Seohaeicola saemankumensis]|uniref:glycosyltransferase n=1 Tax=Seohaeicola saemankumensis TaxID=481181 RepID=UPI0036D3E7BC